MQFVSLREGFMFMSSFYVSVYVLLFILVSILYQNMYTWMPQFCTTHQGRKKREHPSLKRHKNSCVHCSVSELGHSVGCRLQSRRGILRKQLLAISNQHTLSLLPDLKPKIFAPSIAMYTAVSHFSKSIWL